MKKFHCYAARKLKAVHGQVVTAGTHDAAGIDIYVGTTSVGAITVGTNTAGSLLTSGAINIDVPQNGLIELKGKANSATMVVSLVVEHEVATTATETA